MVGNDTVVAGSQEEEEEEEEEEATANDEKDTKENNTPFFIAFNPSVASRQKFPPGCGVVYCHYDDNTQQQPQRRRRVTRVSYGTVVQVGIYFCGNRQNRYQIQVDDDDDDDDSNNHSNLITALEDELVMAPECPVWWLDDAHARAQPQEEEEWKWKPAVVLGAQHTPLAAAATSVKYSIACGEEIHHGIVADRLKYRSLSVEDEEPIRRRQPSQDAPPLHPSHDNNNVAQQQQRMSVSASSVITAASSITTTTTTTTATTSTTVSEPPKNHNGSTEQSSLHRTDHSQDRTAVSNDISHHDTNAVTAMIKKEPSSETAAVTSNSDSGVATTSPSAAPEMGPSTNDINRPAFAQHKQGNKSSTNTNTKVKEETEAKVVKKEILVDPEASCRNADTQTQPTPALATAAAQPPLERNSNHGKSSTTHADAPVGERTSSSALNRNCSHKDNKRIPVARDDGDDPVTASTDSSKGRTTVTKMEDSETNNHHCAPESKIAGTDRPSSWNDINFTPPTSASANAAVQEMMRQQCVSRRGGQDSNKSKNINDDDNEVTFIHSSSSEEESPCEVRGSTSTIHPRRQQEDSGNRQQNTKKPRHHDYERALLESSQSPMSGKRRNSDASGLSSAGSSSPSPFKRRRGNNPAHKHRDSASHTPPLQSVDVSVDKSDWTSLDIIIPKYVGFRVVYKTLIGWKGARCQRQIESEFQCRLLVQGCMVPANLRQVPYHGTEQLVVTIQAPGSKLDKIFACRFRVEQLLVHALPEPSKGLFLVKLGWLNNYHQKHSDVVRILNPCTRKFLEEEQDDDHNDFCWASAVHSKKGDVEEIRRLVNRLAKRHPACVVKFVEEPPVPRHVLITGEDFDAVFACRAGVFEIQKQMEQHSPPTLPAAGCSPRKKSRANPKADADFKLFKDQGVSLKMALEKGQALDKAVPTDMKGTGICLWWHVLGLCRANCKRKSTHRPLSSEEKAATLEWCRDCFVNE
jgi:hypothetical protein